MNKIVVIGAGKTGRGFVGRLLAESGLAFDLVDCDAGLVEKLNRQGAFQVRFFGAQREPVKVSDYHAFVWEEADFSAAELIFVSVGGSNLSAVGMRLKDKLAPDQRCVLITCENCSDPTGRLKTVTKDRPLLSVSEATVFCTTIEDGELNIASENYPYLQCNAGPLNGYIPPAAAVKPVEAFGNLLTRKLFTYNAASCIIAYLGWLLGYMDYGEAANDQRILQLLDQNYAATNRVLCREFGYDPKDQEEFSLLSRRKFTNRTIADTIARNAREPQRKLEREERVIGPMRMLDRYGEDSSVLQMTAAAMLLYDAEGEEEWRKIKKQMSPESILTKLCMLDEGGALFEGIMRYYESFSGQIKDGEKPCLKGRMD